MLIALVPFFVAVLGALVYGLSQNSKVAQLGLVMVLCGLMALCFHLAGHDVRINP